MKQLILILSFIFVFQITFSQEDNYPIVTDRPDQSESTLSVPMKTLQIESGFIYSWDENKGLHAKDITYNSTVFRYGLTKRLEARVFLSFMGNKIEDGSEVLSDLSGLVPVVLGFKWNILYGSGPIPTMAIITDVNIPGAASDDYNDGEFLQNFRLAGSWTLSKVFSLGINLGSTINWEDYDAAGLYTASLGIGITSWMGAFVELYGFFPTGEYADHRFDIGFTFPVRNNLQFDVSGGMGLSKNSPDGFASCGFSWRIPK